LLEQHLAWLFTAKAIAFEGRATKLKLDFTGKPKVFGNFRPNEENEVPCDLLRR
jgi:hypothetical protein